MDGDKRSASETETATSRVTRRELLAAIGGGVILSRREEWWRRTPARRSRATANEWHYRSLSDVAKLLEAREISPVEVTRQLLDRIAALDGDLHSYVTVMDDRAMESARKAGIQAGRYRGPLHRKRGVTSGRRWILRSSRDTRTAASLP